MRYSFVEITRFNGEWVVRHRDLPYDREDEGVHPNPSGFLYYPTEWGPHKGFETLRDSMIENRREAVKKLSAEIAELTKLKPE